MDTGIEEEKDSIRAARTYSQMSEQENRKWPDIVLIVA